METSTEMTSSQTPTDVNRKLRLSSFTTQIIIYISHMYNSEGGILKTNSFFSLKSYDKEDIF